FLTYLKLRSAKNPVPECVSDVYDAETYAKRQAYNAEKCRLSFWSKTAAFIVDLALLIPNTYAAFASLFPKDLWSQMISVFVLSAIGSLFTLPFTYYDTMVIEGKYGFNRTSKKTFIADAIKDVLLQFILMFVIGMLLLLFHQSIGDWIIAAFAAAMTLIMLFIVFLYPVLSRISNKFTPLEDGELKERLTALLEKNGYKVRAIQVMDASRRTTKSNAYFAGFGKMKTIVLFDNLIQTMTTDEIVAVFAHELGHGLHKDTLRNQILTFVQMLIIAVLAWFTLRTPEFFTSFGFSGINYGFAVVLIMSAEFALFMPLFGLIVNAFSRRAEYRADAHAVQEGCGNDLINGLKKLARENYSDLAPSRLLVKLTYSHPTLAERIEAIQKSWQKGA
ncbi:MAG: M48 family metallopeptidase, partial [Lachnospiraceae bacterium]|nr:M48 family metallopeptidase [Lachnospiraceae bacterium]